MSTLRLVLAAAIGLVVVGSLAVGAGAFEPPDDFSGDFRDLVIYADEAVDLGAGTRVETGGPRDVGDIVVAGDNGFFPELIFGAGATIAGNADTDVVGGTVLARVRSQIDADVWSRELLGPGTVTGTTYDLRGITVAGVPSFLTGTPGPDDVAVPSHTTATIPTHAAGADLAYRHLVVGSGATLTVDFDGDQDGSLSVQTIRLLPGASLFVDAPDDAVFLVDDILWAHPGATIGPDRGGPIDASDLAFHVAGGPPHGWLPSVLVGAGADVDGTLFADLAGDGWILVGSRAHVTGALIAPRVVTLPDALVTYASFYGNAPPVAADDLVTTDEDTPVVGDVLADNGNGVDRDADGDPLTVTEVSGSAPDVGATITLGSGALLTQNADGSFTYDPNGAFEFLAVGESATDSYTYTIDDGNGGTDTATVTVTIGGVNDAPALDAIGDRTIDEGAELTFTASADDPDASDVLTFGLLSGPAGATIDPVSGAFGWTTGEADGPGSFPVTVRVDDGRGGTASTSFSITVNEVNEPPSLAAIADQTVDEGSTVSLSAVATDPDVPANALAFSLDPGAPVGASIDPVSGAFGWTTGEADGPGSFPVTVRVDDGRGGTASTSFSITVNEVNEPPSLDPIGDQAVDELSLLTFTATASDPDIPTDTLTFALIGEPPGASIDPATGVFSWTPDATQGGTDYPFDVIVTDGGGLSDAETITVTVTDLNADPVIISPGAVDVDEGTSPVVDVDAIDPDADPLTYSITGGADAAVFDIDPATGVLSFDSPPNFENPLDANGDNVYEVQVTVADGNGGDADQLITVSVLDVDEAPVIVDSTYDAVGNVQLRVDDNPGGAVGTPTTPFVEAANDQPLADNSDDDSVLTAQAGTLATVNGGSVALETDGTFLYTPPVGFEGSDQFTFTVLEDGVDDGATETVSITVSEVVWFVDNTAAGPGTGASQDPFVSLTSAELPSAVGDTIFVHEGAGGSAYGGIVLKNEQTLIGEGVDLIVDSNLLVAAGNDPTVTTITLASDNTVRGLDVGVGGGTGGLTGTSVGALTVADVDTVNGVVDLTGGAPLSVDLGAVTAPRVRVLSSTGTTTIASLAVTSAAGQTGLEAVNAGTLTVNGSTNTITSTNAAAVNISNTTIGGSGMTFASVSSTNATGAGITLSATGGNGFTVTGDAGTAVNGSGGTISGASTDGISLSAVSGVSLEQMTISGAGRHGITGTGVAGFTLSNSQLTGNGDANEENAIDFTGGTSNLTGTALIDNVTVSAFEDIGVDVNNTSGTLDLTISNSTFIDNDDVNGGEAVAVESSGTASFDVAVTNSSFDLVEGDIVAVRALGTGTHDVDITGNTSTNGGGPDDFPSGGGVSLVVDDGASITFDIQGNSLVNAIQGIRVTGDGDAEGRIGGPDVADGNIVTLRADVGPGSGDAVEIDMGGSTATPSTGNRTWTILIQNNDVGGDPGSPTATSDGIGVLHRDSNGTLNVTIEDNTIHDIGDQGIDVFTDEDSAAAITPLSFIRIVGNDFSGLADDAIEVDADETADVCVHIVGNDDGLGGSPGLFDLDQRGDPATSLSVTQTSTAAISTDNAGATVVPGGTLTFNDTCTTPTLPANG